VRKLAEASKQAAGSIAALVAHIQDATTAAIVVVDEKASGAFEASPRPRTSSRPPPTSSPAS